MQLYVLFRAACPFKSADFPQIPFLALAQKLLLPPYQQFMLWREEQMNRKSTSYAFMIALVAHAIIAFVAGIYLVTQTERVKDLIGIEVLRTKVPPKPIVGRPVVKSVIKPTVAKRNTEIGYVQVQPRVTSVTVRKSDFRPERVIRFSEQPIKVEAPINPSIPRVVTPSSAVPAGGIRTDLPASDAPNALAFSSPVVIMSPTRAKRISHGITGRLTVTFQRPPGLSMVENVGAARDALDDVVENIILSKHKILPLPKGEPGGRVIGKGKDIQGVFRFTRLRHNLSDWWADASSLNALTKWLNERTKIKTDMSVEGGGLKLTDTNLFKTPLTFLTGHDPSLARSRELLGNGYSAGKIDGRFTEAEAAGLRRYLVEKGGFLVFDDCGVNAPAQAMVRLFLAQMRYVMPEYHVERISNNHEIYNNFYEMGGPPVGYDIFWWGTRPPKRNFLEGISVGAKLSVIVVRRDYMCAMESISLATRSVHYSPGVYRFMTNVVVYALTHGGISDYSGYVPESALEETRFPARPPAAADRIGFE
ncbi:hypothetical protein C6496_17560 [Candidatus Poribacteria bacterium]|nr:MAG: hypothetical protein C6496_17560 [Candidatus Poribacteria bacterium]